MGIEYTDSQIHQRSLKKNLESFKAFQKFIFARFVELACMKKFIILFICIVSNKIIAQSYNRENVNTKAIKLYEQALVLLSDGDTKNAISLLEKTIQSDNQYVDAYLSLAGAYGELKNYTKAIEYYETAKQKDSIYFKPYTLPYSINLAGIGKFEEALQSVSQFLSINGLNEKSIKAANYRKRCYEFAIQFAKEHPFQTNFNPVNLGDSVNTEKSEYYPSLSIDDSLLLFTRRGEGFREDFFQSIRHHNGQYSKATLIGGDINKEPYKGGITISSDGDWLIFAGNFRNGFGNFDLYISYYTAQGWSEPENLGPNINTEYWESSPSLSPDNHILYFSSNRPGGSGGKDLYMSVRQPNGKFGPAQNMGPSLNSIGDETAPYIHADNQTLYFTSDGLPGYGGTDIFICRKDSLGNWGKPENLGYPINTIENEGSIAVASNARYAYFASDRSDSRGGLDIYEFDMPQNLRPKKTLFIKGSVFDAVTGKSLPCKIELINNSNRQILMSIQTDEVGKYFIPLPVGNNYTFSVQRKGYLYYTDVFDVANKYADSNYQKDIALQPIRKNAVLTFRNIQFELNSSELKPVSIIELNKLFAFLQENPTVNIQLSGHTDNTGIESQNLILSTARAKAVAQFLVDKGIDAHRLKYKGFGSSVPVADNTTEAGRSRNRRTEFIVLDF